MSLRGALQPATTDYFPTGQSNHGFAAVSSATGLSYVDRMRI
ncbi:hypothetical protein [Pseudorhodoferax sp. Leaf267]|nr:hypothetical protein [Pseudorhodoferax sp. Leaf267]